MNDRSKIWVIVFLNIIFGLIAMTEIIFYKWVIIIIGASLMGDSPGNNYAVINAFYFIYAIAIGTYPVTYLCGLAGSIYYAKKNKLSRALNFSYIAFYHLLVVVSLTVLFIPIFIR